MPVYLVTIHGEFTIEANSQEDAERKAGNLADSVIRNEQILRDSRVLVAHMEEPCKDDMTCVPINAALWADPISDGRPGNNIVMKPEGPSGA